MLKLNHIILCCVLLVIGHGWLFAQEQQTAPAVTGETIISVLVNNGTADGAAVTGDRVILSLYNAQQEPVDSISSVVDNHGVCIFEAVPVFEGMIALASCEHQGVRFQGQAILVDAANENHRMTVWVYDVSNDSSVLTVSTHHLVLKREDTKLNVHEYMRLENNTDKAIGSEKMGDDNQPAVITIHLPQGYSHFAATSYLEESGLKFLPDRVEDMMAAGPGQYNINFSYELEIEDAHYTFKKLFALASDDFTVYKAMPDITLSGLGESSEFTLADGMVGEYYSVGPVNADSTISFELSNWPVVKKDQSWIMLVVVFVIVFIVVLLRLKQSKKPETK